MLLIWWKIDERHQFKKVTRIVQKMSVSKNYHKNVKLGRTDLSLV